MRENVMEPSPFPSPLSVLVKLPEIQLNLERKY
jgi:hypothetical protein